MEMAALVIFAVAALGGVFLAYRHLQGLTLPVPVAVIHGVAAATALVLLAIAVLADDVNGLATTALIVFVVAALGGFYLASFHLRDDRRPTPLVIGHGLIAVVGFVMLLVAVI